MDELTFEVGFNVSTIGISFESLPPVQSVLVAKVHAGTWAEKTGIVHGDQLIALNGRGTAKMERADFMLTLNARPLALRMARPHQAPRQKAALDLEEDLELSVELFTGSEASLANLEAVEPIPSETGVLCVDNVVEDHSGSEVAPEVDLVVRGGEDDAKLGLSFESAPPGKVVVDNVLAGTLAEVAGVEPGDWLVSINDRDVDGMQRKEFIEAMKARPIILRVHNDKQLQRALPPGPRGDVATRSLDKRRSEEFDLTTAKFEMDDVYIRDLDGVEADFFPDKEVVYASLDTTGGSNSTCSSVGGDAPLVYDLTAFDDEIEKLQGDTEHAEDDLCW